MFAVPGIESSLELRIYQGLLRLGWKPEQIEVQTPILGGRGQPGGQVLDFVLHRPAPLPIYANGDYWHPDSYIESIQIAEAMELYQVEPAIIWGSEAVDDRSTDAILERKVGRA